MFFKKGITRKPLFWIIFVALSFASIAFTIKYFSKAIPIVNIDIKMDRSSALANAKKLAEQFSWGPADHRQAAVFKTDQQAKVFVELECGGKDVLIKMMKDDLYMPYTWIVRHFKQFEKNEVYIKFSPDGKPYGFKEVISENEIGNDLPIDQAKKIAETDAEKNWNIDLKKYKLAESSKEVKPSMRGDHTFVYERIDKKIGDGFYRLKIVVSGDKVTEVNHFIKIPENFTNKYKEMRAANNAIAYGASLLFLLLYILGGCIIGLLFLFKSKYVLWKASLIVGSFVAVLFLINQINVIPIAWMSYNTVSSQNVFLLRYFISIFSGFLYKLFLFTLSFMAAESLTRKAFGNHIQFWNIWSKDNASSVAVAGRTIGGYLLAGVQLAYVVAIYFVSTKLLGWWSPSDELVNPNVLSHYLPWFSSLSRSFTAGFWEECLFRAVPLSCAALLGKKYGKRNWWIAAAFILQAIIFGAAHANYPAQPAYARLVELILPSFMFAGVYLKFGLLPSVITHFIYDLILMSMPLFVSSAPYAWVNQLIVILLGLIPLLIVLLARLKVGSWTEIKEKYLNAYWQPTQRITQQKKKEPVIQKIASIKTTILGLLLLGTVAGIASWVYFTPFKHNATPLNVSQQESIDIAKKDLKALGITFDNTWTALPKLADTFDYGLRQSKTKSNRHLQHRFIWQHDKKLYRSLLGSYLNEPQWIVRFVKFQGNLNERAEQYIAFVNKEKKVYRIKHKIPEDREDEKLTEQKARTIAHTHLVQKFKLDPKKLKEISAKSKKLKNRINWKFIFSNKNVYPLDTGEARILIKVDGDDVSNAYRYIHVPEEWARKEKNYNNIKNIFTMLCYLILFAFALLAVMLTGKGLVAFSKKYALISVILFAIITFLLNANQELKLIALFDPIQPFYTQLFRVVGSLLILTILSTSIMSIAIGLVTYWKTRVLFSKNIRTIISTISIATLLAGVAAVIEFFKPSLQPLWPQFANLESYLPAINLILSHLLRYIIVTSFALLFATALDYIQNNWKSKRFIIPVFFLLGGLATYGMYGIDCIGFWAIAGTVMGMLAFLAYTYFIKFDLSTIPLIIAILKIFKRTQQALFGAYDNILPISIISSVVILAVAILWFMRLNKGKKYNI